MGWIDIRMKETDSRSFSAHRPQTIGDRIDLTHVERGQDAAFGVETLRHTRGQLSIDDRSRQRYEDVVQLGTRLTPNVQYVLEARSREQRNARALAFEHRVRCDGGSVNDVGALVG